MSEANDKSKTKEKSGHATIVIKKIKKHGHGHHGGSWKIAYADFVTAMMAFFLLMWLIASLNKAQKEGIAEYFKQPVKISFFGGDNVGNQQIKLKGGGPNVKDTNGQVASTKLSSSKDSKQQQVQVIQANKSETQKLEELKSEIALSIKNDPSLSGLKDQLLMEVVKDGLRIQLIDNQKDPMFDVGSEKLNEKFVPIFTKISKLLNGVPNRISIQGHTDAHPYHNPDELEYTNWELSTQRANAARRALLKSGMDENKVMDVSGFASTMLLDEKNPESAVNRRISIIVMKQGIADNTSGSKTDIEAEIKKINPANGKAVSPASGKAASPATDKVASPATDKAASPATGKAASPATDKAASPATDKAASPATDKAASPATDKVASPATDKVASPATDKAASPATDKAASPATDKSASPVHN